MQTSKTCQTDYHRRPLHVDSPQPPQENTIHCITSINSPIECISSDSSRAGIAISATTTTKNSDSSYSYSRNSNNIVNISSRITNANNSCITLTIAATEAGVAASVPKGAGVTHVATHAAIPPTAANRSNRCSWI